MNKSVSLNLPVSFVEVEAINPLITRATVKILYAGKNRNKSYISKEVAEQMCCSLPNIPIVGEWDSSTQDFGGHGRISIEDGEVKKSTIPIGVVPADTKIWWETFLDADGVEREYLCSHAYIWTGRYSIGKKIFEGNANNQSMELDPSFVKGYWTKLDNENDETFIVEEAVFSALCVLGENVTPAFEGASFNPIYTALSSYEKNNIDLELNELREELMFALSEKTNFPYNGDNKAISLRNSHWKVFDPKFAETLKKNHPVIWKLGGNIKGNSQYSKLIRAIGKESSSLNDTLKDAIKLREAWGARHKDDHLIAGVIAQVKWLVVGSRGESFMKSLIKEEIKKRSGDHSLSEFELLLGEEEKLEMTEETEVVEVAFEAIEEAPVEAVAEVDLPEEASAEFEVEAEVEPEAPVVENSMETESPVVEIEPEAQEQEISLKDLVSEIVKEVLSSKEEEKNEYELESAIASYKKEIADLKEKISTYETKEKGEMISKFEKLVDSDSILEIKENLHNYSLEQIESVLSIKAVKNSLLQSKEDRPVVEFTLPSEESKAPAWISALK